MSRSKAPMFILAGNGPCLNRGSEAIVRSTIAILTREFGACDFVSSAASEHAVSDPKIITLPNVKHVCRGPVRRFSPDWFRIQIRRRLLGQSPLPFAPYLRKADAVVVRAGDNFTLDYGPALPRRLFAAVEIVRKAGKCTILYGATIGPFDADPEFEMAAFEELKRVTMICARESITAAYLSERGISENVCQVPDPAFVLEPDEPRLDPQIGTMLDEGCLGVNVSPLLGRYLDEPEAWPERAMECLAAIDRRVDAPILLVPHVTYSASDDYTFMAEVLKGMGTTRNPVRLVARTPNAPQMKWVISRLKAFIGARTHATVAALSSCVPTASIGYSRKASGINQDIYGHLEWLVPLSSLQPDRLAEVAERLLAQAAEVRGFLGQRMPAYIDRAWSGGACIRQAMEAGDT